MRHAGLLLRLTTAVFVALVVTGCGSPEPGWERLWPDQWTWHSSGEAWVRGVVAAGRSFYCPGNRQRLRTELLNLGAGPATVRMIAARTDVEWTLAGGESRTVEATLNRGEVRVEAPHEVVLGSPRLGRPLGDARLVVVILVDTLRDDHVTPELMPGVVDAFAGGRRWLDVTANSPWTLPSVASMFSSRPVLDVTSPEGEVIGLPRGLPTWAGRLDEAGFLGGAVVANYTVHALNGFAEGFASYRVPDGHGDDETPDGSWVVDEARRWLAAHAGEDAFLYLHLMDPHEPYRRHAGSGPSPPPLKPLATGRQRATEDQVRLLRELYAGEVRHVDGVLAPFLTELPVDSVVVFTSDHGEALGEHGAWAHGLTLYQEALAVPLLLRGPGVAAGETGRPVQLLDLAPTLLELGAVAPDPGFAGSSLLSGAPGAPMVSVTFSAGPLRWAWRRGDDKVVVRTAAQPGLGAASRAVLAEGRPLPAGAFFVDLSEDPGEDRPGPIPERLQSEVGAAFASSAGRLVPGLQLLVWGSGAPAVVALGTASELDIVQAWSTGRIDVVQEPGRFELRCSQADPLCAVAVAAASVPETVIPVGGTASWWSLSPGSPVDPRGLDPPAGLAQGAHLWWNPDRPLIVGGHHETLERLRALGYID